jgi:hypothetical protein
LSFSLADEAIEAAAVLRLRWANPLHPAEALVEEGRE